TGEPKALAAFLDPVPEIVPFVGDDPLQAVSQGDADVAARLIASPRGKPGDLDVLSCEVYYRAGSTTGREAVRYLEQLTSEANAQQMIGPLDNVRKLPQPFAERLLPRSLGVVRLNAVEAPDHTPKKSPLVPVLVPLLLVLMTMTGAVYP